MKKLLLVLLFTGSASCLGQAPGTATWQAKAQPASKQGIAVVNLTAHIEKGWHIYAQSQPPGGPNPLRVTLEQGSAYELTGSITGTVPQKHHDASFDLETEFYTDAFTLKVPVKATPRRVYRSQFITRCAAIPPACRRRRCT